MTENQLALLWKMADEPILCFDGDKAGQKAAWRAADLAMPHLKPGKKLRFALLPEGQDPDDLARSGGRAAIEEVISAARGLADVIWSREIEGGILCHAGTPRGAGGRIGELTNGIRDEVVRRYYRQDLAERLQRTFAPEGGRGGYGRGNFRGGQSGISAAESGRRFAPRACHPGRPADLPSLGGRGQDPAGGQTSPPALSGRQPADGHQPDHARPAQRGLPPRGADPAIPDQPSLAAARPPRGSGRAGTGPSRSAQIARRNHRGLRPRPSPCSEPANRPRRCAPTSRRSDFASKFKWLIGRSRPRTCGAPKPAPPTRTFFPPGSSSLPCIKAHALLREKKDAELALGDEASEANLAWLRDVQAGWPKWTEPRR